jgi:hypothetical protein
MTNRNADPPPIEVDPATEQENAPPTKLSIRGHDHLKIKDRRQFKIRQVKNLDTGAIVGSGTLFKASIEGNRSQGQSGDQSFTTPDLKDDAPPGRYMIVWVPDPKLPNDPEGPHIEIDP